MEEIEELQFECICGCGMFDDPDEADFIDEIINDDEADLVQDIILTCPECGISYKLCPGNDDETAVVLKREQGSDIWENDERFSIKSEML